MSEAPRERASYPGLQRQESALWRGWMRRHGRECEWCSYGVTVGEAPGAPEGAPEWLLRDWEALTLLRVDVVVGWRDRVWVVEIKPRASMSGLGQCVVYASLLVAERRVVDWPGMLVVSGVWREDLEPGYRRCGVEWEVVDGA